MKDIPEVFSMAAAARYLKWDHRVIKKWIDEEKFEPFCRLGRLVLYSQEQMNILKRKHARK